MKIFVLILFTFISWINTWAQYVAQTVSTRGEYFLTSTQGLEFQSFIYYSPSVYNDCGDLAYQAILTHKETLTAIKKLDSRFTIKSSPNPATDWLTIEWNTNPPKYCLDIVNLLGVRILKIPPSDALIQKINLSSYASGVYILQILTSDQSIYSTKIIKS